MKRIITSVAYSICILSVLLAVMPLLGRRFIPTHDGEYHIIRFKEFYTMLQSGFLAPRWAPDLNSGYGIPLFNFHYPMPDYIGAFFHMGGVSFVDAFKLSLALGYLLSVFFCFLWLLRIFSRNAAIVGTMIFSFVPYLFVDIYVRGSIGEVYAIVFVLSALVCIEYDRKIFFSLSIAALVLSHNIGALIFSPLLLGYIYIKNIRYIRYAMLGLGMAAYFWIPAITEMKYVVGLNSVDFRDHFPLLLQLLIPSWGTGFSRPGYGYDELSFQIGLVALGLYAWSTISILRTRTQNRNKALLFLGLSIFYFFLMLSVSLVVWESFPLLQFIQYPWRLLSIVPLSAAFLAAYCIDNLRKYKIPASVMLVLCSVAFSYCYTRPVTYESRSDDYYFSRKEFTDGTSSLGNSFSTIWTPWKNERFRNRVQVSRGDATLKVIRVNPIEYTFEANAAIPSQVRFNVLYYPGWTVIVNKAFPAIDYTSGGIIQFNIPAGKSAGKVYFAETLSRKTADLVSEISFIILCIMLIKNRYARSKGII